LVFEAFAASISPRPMRMRRCAAGQCFGWRGSQSLEQPAKDYLDWKSANDSVVALADVVSDISEKIVSLRRADL
jgi:hypothetical protein